MKNNKNIIIAIVSITLLCVAVVLVLCIFLRKEDIVAKLDKNVSSLRVDVYAQLNTDYDAEEVEVHLDNVDYISAVKNSEVVFLTTFEDRKLIKWSMEEDEWLRDEFEVDDINESNLSNLYTVPLNTLKYGTQKDDHTIELRLQNEDKNVLTSLVTMITTEELPHFSEGYCICTATLNDKYIEKYDCKMNGKDYLTLTFSGFNTDDIAKRAYEGDYIFE